MVNEEGSWAACFRLAKHLPSRSLDAPPAVAACPPGRFVFPSDFVYHAAEICSLILAAGCVVLMSTKLKSSYQKEVDSFGDLHVPTEWGTLYIFVPCLLLAVVSFFVVGIVWVWCWET